MRIAIYGIWHLGSVISACLAKAGHDVTALDPCEKTIADLHCGRPPIEEPGLAALMAEGVAGGRLAFTADPRVALEKADVLWVAFDTPVDDRDEADVGFVRASLEAIAEHIAAGTLVLVSSQVPIGFTRALERDWQARGLRYAYSPENLRLGKAIESFCQAERVIVGSGSPADRPALEAIFRPFTPRIEWMSLESAEMTKHAINAFLATSVTFINELARLCEVLGADAKEVERGLKSEGRIGPRAYLGPGVAFSGGTLARDVRFLLSFGKRESVETPLLRGVLESNQRHQGWLHDHLAKDLEAVASPVAAVLGLTYKPGTNTLRRSAAVELCRWLHARGVRVQAHDPAIRDLPEELQASIVLCSSPQQALTGADVAVVATEWPDYRALGPDDFLHAMRRAQVVDPGWFLAQALAQAPQIRYVATGKGTHLSQPAHDPQP